MQHYYAGPNLAMQAVIRNQNLSIANNLASPAFSYPRAPALALPLPLAPSFRHSCTRCKEHEHEHERDVIFPFFSPKNELTKSSKSITLPHKNCLWFAGRASSKRS